MNTLHSKALEVQRERLESDLCAHTEPLFRDWPMLRGFSVLEGAAATPIDERVAAHLAGALFVADVACYPELGEAQRIELCGDIAAALAELLDEQPEALELLRGRTLVRTLN